MSMALTVQSPATGELVLKPRAVSQPTRNPDVKRRREACPLTTPGTLTKIPPGFGNFGQELSSRSAVSDG